MSLLLSHSELETIQEIKDADYLTITKGKDKNGIPFLKHIFDFNQKIYGQICSNCPTQIPNYINRIKTFKIDKMENIENVTNEFQLKKDVIIPIPGTSEAYSEHNITDEIAISLLSENENRISLFEKVPNDYEDLIQDFRAKQLEVELKEELEVQLEVELEELPTNLLPNNSALEQDSKQLEVELKEAKKVIKFNNNKRR